jgi:hypothetical protein
VHVPDEASALFQARGLVEQGTLEVPEAAPGFEFYGKRDLDGRPRAPYGPAHAAAIAPFYTLGKVMAGAPGVPAGARDLVHSFGAVLSSAVFAAAAAAAFHRLLERRGVPPGAALLATAGLALGTPLFFYAATLFSEPLAALLFAGAALLLFPSAFPVTPARAVAAGALLAAALLVRPAHALAVPVFAAAVLARDGRRGARAAAALAMVAAAGLAGYFAWNGHLFGDPLDFGYPATAEGGKRLNSFETPLGRGLFGFLFSPGKSIFLFAPVAIAAVAGLPRLFARDFGLGVIALGAPLVYLVFYARYTQWEGGYCFGPRYLVPVLPLFLLGAGTFLEAASRARRALLAALVFGGIIVEALGLATSFLEVERHGGYYGAGFEYRMGWTLAPHARLFAEYAGAAVRGEPPPPLGKGFDRWFLFLRRAGVAWPPIAALMAVAAAGLVVAAIALYRAMPRASEEGAAKAKR